MSEPRYTFKQTITDVTVSVPLAPGTRAKTLKVDIGKTSIAAALASGETLISGPLFRAVDTDGSVWSVEDQRELVITLDKTVREWWPHVVTTDPKIDVTKLEPENSSLADLDPETRATVEKMMFDQQQKQKGLPSSDELQKQQQLKKFMDAHPEMDFSQVQLPK